ncbi:phage tape measure protein [Fibrella aestuarina BUZ 2]|uniref:Phage tape measure protein n=1 Tax=Fibrella aestuarina BUZ 2 TaxID=1166018 RepID=I0KCX1_9BACT|nr:tape measure protein [Fibrella aestuarina]CCH01974.1 phage tape measure protein [Fibrella aestuarina BUZ 2]
MDTTERLSVSIDGNLSGFERSIGRAVGLLARVEAAGSRAGRGFDNGFGASITRTTQRVGLSIEQLNNRLALLTQRRNLSLDTGVIARTNREIDGLQRRINQLQNTGLSTSSSTGFDLSGFIGPTAAITAATTAVTALKGALNIADEMNRLDAGLKAVSTSSADFARMQSFLRGLSDQLGISYSALADGYKGLKASTNGTNLQGAETERIFRSVVNAGAALKLSNEEVKGSLRALTQMMSTGTVQSDELKSELASHLPNAFGLAAKAMGVTTSELSKLLERGEVLASDMLPKLATQLEKTYGKNATDNVNNLTGATTRLTNQSRELIQSFDNASGASTFFASIVNGAADSLRGIRQLVEDKSWAVLANQLLRLKDNPVSLFVGNNVLTQASLVAKDRQQFAGMDRTAQQARLQGLKDSIEQRRSQITDLDRGKLKDSVIKPKFYYDLKKTLATEEASLAALLSDFKKPFNQVLSSRTANAPVANLPKPVTDYVDIYKKDKDRYDALIQKREALRAYNQSLNAADSHELAALQTKMERANPKKYGPKPIAQSIRQDTTIDILKRIQGNLKKEIESLLADGVPFDQLPTQLLDNYEAVVKKVAVAEEETKKLEEATKRLVTKIESLSQLKIRGGAGAPKRASGGRESADDSANRAELLGVPTVSASGDFGKYGAHISTVTSHMDDYVAQYTAKLKQSRDAIQASKAMFTDMGTGAITALSESIMRDLNEGKAPLQNALSLISGILGDFIMQLGQTVLKTGSLELLAGAFPGLQGFLLTGPAKIGAGLALIAGGAALKTAKFAEGGHVIGQGTGTSDSIPAWLSNGEYVLKASAVNRLGVGFLNHLNQGRLPGLATGGLVGAVNTPQFGVRGSDAYERANYQMAKGESSNSRSQKLDLKLSSQVRGTDLQLIQDRQARKNRYFGRD